MMAFSRSNMIYSSHFQMLRFPLFVVPIFSGARQRGARHLFLRQWGLWGHADALMSYEL